MFRSPLTLFNAATEAGTDCAIHYLWLNKEADVPGRPFPCSLPLKLLDRAYSNAAKYPKAKVNIWLDFRFLDETSFSHLREYQAAKGRKNVQIKDLTDIPAYHEKKLFRPGTKTHIWSRVDFARIIVLDDALANQPEKYAIYADLDVKDVRLYEAKQRMDKLDFAVAKTGAATHILGDVFIGGMGWDFLSMHTEIENGYIAFKKNDAGKALLQELLSLTRGAAKLDCNGYSAFLSWVDKQITRLGMQKNETGFAIPNVMCTMGYSLSDKKRYKTLNRPNLGDRGF